MDEALIPSEPPFNELALRQARMLCDNVALPELQRALQGIPGLRAEDFRHHKEKLSGILLEEHLRRLGEHVPSTPETLRALAQIEAAKIRKVFDEARSSATLDGRSTAPPALAPGTNASKSAIAPKTTCDRIALVALRQEIPSLVTDHSGELTFQTDLLSEWLLEEMLRRMQENRPVDENTLRTLARSEARKRQPDVDRLLSARAQSQETPRPATAIDRLAAILCRFHLVARQLLKRRENRPTLAIQDEYDVQDLLHALLKTAFNDIRPEEWTPSYAGGAARMDFLLKAEGIVVECKKTRDGLREKQLGEELLIDIAKYAAHQDCKTLVCFVYDPEGLVGNPTGLKSDLEKAGRDSLKVIVEIVP